MRRAQAGEGLRRNHQDMGRRVSYSQGIRGDNTPENARYLGYLDGRELYPDLQLKTLESFFQDVLDEKVQPVYQEKFAARRAQAQE